MIPEPAAHRHVIGAVCAHPDDGSFGPGGTLAKYVAEGAEVWLVCGAAGSAGTVEAALLTDYASTGQLRAVLTSFVAGTLHQTEANGDRSRRCDHCVP